MANKRERQATIRELIDARPVESQEELRKLLLKRGWDVTQSTLSRDLREMRVARVPGSDGAPRYTVTTTSSDDARPPLEALLPHLFTAIDGVGELIVLHTLPGGAQPIGVAFDAEEWQEVLGTLAGDDTVLIICRSASLREKVMRKLRVLAGACGGGGGREIRKQKAGTTGVRWQRAGSASSSCSLLPALCFLSPPPPLTRPGPQFKYARPKHIYSSAGAPMIRTIVLAYSGGLDTSIIVPWLRERYDARVICVAGDVGQGDELEGVRAKALASGAEECYIEDVREEFITDFIWPTLRAGATYGRKYLLGTSMARPLIAKRQVEVARAVGADALAHGCTGKGNDQVRFELTYAAFAPELPVIAPWREWDIRSREDAIEYAEAHGIPISATKAKIYSRDRNIWHISHEGGVLEDPASVPPDDLFMLSTNPAEAPNTPEDVTIGFDKGTPVSVNGKAMGAVELLTALNEIGGRHGVGRIDLVEDRLVGMKSRGVYETPGGTLLYTAHSELEQLVLDRRTLAAKDVIAPRYADLVYEGRWWTTEREAYDAFVNTTQETVTGSITLRLFKGTANIAGRSSEHALYDERFVTFGEDDVYEQADAAGFIRLYGLSQRVRALKNQEAAAKAAADEPDAVVEAPEPPRKALAIA
jgi:argininosuccinate synthase